MDNMTPREKLRLMGAEALSDVELLAIFLRTGTVGANVMTLAQQMLQRFGSLYHIMTAGPAEFDEIKASALRNWRSCMLSLNWRGAFSPARWRGKM